MEAAGTPVDEVVQAISADIKLAGGAPRMSDDALIAHAAAVSALDAARKRVVAAELIALCTRMAQAQKEGWDAALAQLSLLAAVGLGGLAQAQRALAQGLGEDKARALIGATTSLRPVGGGSGVSPLHALLLHKTKGSGGP